MATPHPYIGTNNKITVVGHTKRSIRCVNWTTDLMGSLVMMFGAVL